MEATSENKNKYTALGLTLIFHVILFLIFIWVVFVTPIPPFEVKPVPEIEIGLGMEGLGNKDAGGSGKHDPEVATKPETPVVTKTTPIVQPTPAPEKLITDETGEPVDVVKNTPKKKPKKQKEPVVETPPKPVEEKASSELSNALAILKSKKKHVGSGDGGGDRGGSGTGNNQGVGDGSGTGHGNGNPGYNGGGGYDLKGRSLVRKPAPMTDPDEEGTVVVEIIVDENGKVVRATPGQRGSTTTSANLYSKARQAAMQAKFNPSPNGAKEQRGTYTFVFTLE
jgi:TonB family protein